MERRPWLVLLALGLSLPSAAGSLPEVPSAALSDVPESVRDGFDERVERIQQMTREIEAARSTTSLVDAVDAVEEARRDLRATLSAASNLRGVARSRLQVVQLSSVDAKIGLDTAKLERRLARSDLDSARGGHDRGVVREARRHLVETREGVDAAKDHLESAATFAARTEHTAADQLAVADDAMAAARRALNEVGATAAGVGRQRITGPEIALLEARRDLAVAQLEHDRAMAAYTTGARLRLRPFLDALDEARDAEADARQALTPPQTVELARRDRPRR